MKTQISNAYQTTCRLAAEAGLPKPAFVEWGKIYKTAAGSFRIVSGFQDTGKNIYEDDSGKIRKLAKGNFNKLIAFIEEVA